MNLRDYMEREDEKQMRESFWARAREILNDPSQFDRTGDQKFQVGIELEYSIVDNKFFEQASEDDRNAIRREINDHYGWDEAAGPELGAFQLEPRTKPIDMRSRGFGAVLEALTNLETVAKKAASKRKFLLVRIGAYPTIEPHAIRRSTERSKEDNRYQEVPNFHSMHMRQGIDTTIGLVQRVDVRNPAVIGLCNAIHCSVDAVSTDDAIDKLNRSLAIGPYGVALCSNARFLASKDLGYADFRMIAWEVSHDVRTSEDLMEGRPLRVGLPCAYYVNLEDYFARVASYPFILTKDTKGSFKQGIGLYWNDARIKFNDEEKRAFVEFRPLSMQPSVKEDVAAIVWFVGRLIWSQKEKEQLLDLALVRENRYAAMKKGLDATLWYQDQRQLRKGLARDILPTELDRAQEGLREEGLADEIALECLSVLRERLNGGTPVERFAQSVYEHHREGLTMQQALVLSLNEICVA